MRTNHFPSSKQIYFATSLVFTFHLFRYSSVQAWSNIHITTSTSRKYQVLRSRDSLHQCPSVTTIGSPISVHVNDSNNDASVTIEHFHDGSGVNNHKIDAFHNDMNRVLLSRLPTYEDYLTNMATTATENAKKAGEISATGSTSSDSIATTMPPLTANASYEDYLRVHRGDSCDQRDVRWNRHLKPIVLETDVDGALCALSMLRHLQDIQADSEMSYQIVMQAFLNRGRLRWVRKSDSLALDMEESNTGMREMTITRNRVRNNHETKSIVCAADQIEELLFELEQRHSTLQISLRTFNLVLEAYAVCSTPRGNRNYAERASLLYERVQDRFATSSPNSPSNENILVQSAMHLCHAYAWQQANMEAGICAQLADDWLIQIQTNTIDVASILKAHNWVIEAWSKSASQGSAKRADELLQTVKTLNSTIVKGTKAFRVAREVFDAQLYTNTILALTKANDANSTERADALLNEMADLHESGALPDGSEPQIIAFNGVIAAWSRVGRPEKAEQILWKIETLRSTCKTLEPSTISFNSVLAGYLVIRDTKFSLQKAIALVDYMEDNCSKQPAIKPNCFTYNLLMQVWIRSTSEPLLAEMAEKLLQKMEYMWEKGDYSLEPTSRTFNLVINSYAKSNHPEAANKAFDLLKRMKVAARRNSKFSKCAPDIVSYTTAIECASKSCHPNAPVLAENLLKEAMELYEASGDTRLMPNLRTYTMTILTLAKHNGNPVRARELLTQLVETYKQTANPDLAPNTYPYNYVLNCAANSVGDRVEAFQIATQTYQEMRKSDILKPDSFTYAFWIKCCNTLLSDDSDLKMKCISYAFQECKRDGLLSNEVLTRLFQGSPSSLVNELLGLSTKKTPEFLTTTTTSSSSKKSSFGLSEKTTRSTSLLHQQQLLRYNYRNMKVNDFDSSWSRNIRKTK